MPDRSREGVDVGSCVPEARPTLSQPSLPEPVEGPPSTGADMGIPRPSLRLLSRGKPTSGSRLLFREIPQTRATRRGCPSAHVLRDR